LHRLSEGTSNNVLLLFFSQRVETYCVARYTDGQLRIFFRVFHRVEQHFTVHHVNVQVLTTFDGCFVVEVTIHQTCQVVLPNFVVFTQCVRNDREGVGDTIFSVSKRQFSNGSQRRYSTFLVTTVHRVSTRSERRASTTTVWGVTSFLTIHNVRSDGQNRLSRDSVTVGVQFLNFLHETFYQVNSQVIYTRIIVTKLRVFAFDFEVDSQTVFVTNRFNFR